MKIFFFVIFTVTINLMISCSDNRSKKNDNDLPIHVTDNDSVLHDEEAENIYEQTLNDTDQSDVLGDIDTHTVESGRSDEDSIHDVNISHDEDIKVNNESELSNDEDSGTKQIDPPIGKSSKGSGGTAPISGDLQNTDGINYYLIVPAEYSESVPIPLLLVYSGTEGGSNMTKNLISLEAVGNLGGYIKAILDGKNYYGNGTAGSKVIDHLRTLYNIDNDRTYLLSESAGTSAGLELGFTLKQSYFAAFWVNDLNDSSFTPAKNSTELGFKPWGQAGPGGNFSDANIVINSMKEAGYRLPTEAPYNGTGADAHGNTTQFINAAKWFYGKSRTDGVEK